MKKILALVVAVAAVLMLVVMVTGTGSGQTAVAPGSASAIAVAGVAAATGPLTASSTATGPGLDKVLTLLADKANSTLPMMVDRNTRWDTTMAGPGKNFTYFYTMPGHASADLDPVATREAIAPQVTGNVCGNKDMQVMFKAGVTAHYVYRGNDGAEVVRLAIAPADCGVSPDPSFKPEDLIGPA